MMDDPRAEDFAPHVGKMVRFARWHGSLRLVRVDIGRAMDDTGERQAFTLIFSGPRGDVMREGMREAIAESGERWEFHIMPIHTPAPDRQDYQVVFN